MTDICAMLQLRLRELGSDAVSNPNASLWDEELDENFKYSKVISEIELKEVHPSDSGKEIIFVPLNGGTGVLPEKIIVTARGKGLWSGTVE